MFRKSDSSSPFTQANNRHITTERLISRYLCRFTALILLILKNYDNKHKITGPLVCQDILQVLECVLVQLSSSQRGFCDRQSPYQVPFPSPTINHHQLSVNINDDQQ